MFLCGPQPFPSSDFQYIFKGNWSCLQKMVGQVFKLLLWSNKHPKKQKIFNIVKIKNARKDALPGLKISLFEVLFG